METPSMNSVTATLWAQDPSYRSRIRDIADDHGRNQRYLRNAQTVLQMALMASQLDIGWWLVLHGSAAGFVNFGVAALVACLGWFAWRQCATSIASFEAEYLR